MSESDDRKIVFSEFQKDDELIEYEAVDGILITFWLNAASASFWYKGQKYSQFYANGTPYSKILSIAKQWVAGCEAHVNSADYCLNHLIKISKWSKKGIEWQEKNVIPYMFSNDVLYEARKMMQESINKTICTA